VAALPDNKHVLASTKATLQTDMVTSVFLVALRIHSLVFSLAALCAGMTITFGAESVCNRVIGHDLHPGTGMNRLRRLGDRVQAEWRVGRSGSVNVLENLPGPVKSIMTAPSEIRNATGILP
jgi:hypothetical protein